MKTHPANYAKRVITLARYGEIIHSHPRSYAVKRRHVELGRLAAPANNGGDHTLSSKRYLGGLLISERIDRPTRWPQIFSRC
jgi:hypothetical protein